ncbi:unnamed protein product [Rhizophagus irregularis]|nr:unnamed protein product [Rhizophagus irregularis]CAB4422033.1 unnamed protein product [Rhizophagus irregularis]
MYNSLLSKIYKATWIDGPHDWSTQPPYSSGKMTVVRKELSNTSNINSKELNELTIFYNYATNNKNKKGYTYHDHFHYINKYFGITQHPITQNLMIITKYCEYGDYIANDFYNINCGNILVATDETPIIGDLGISKSATEPLNDDDYELFLYFLMLLQRFFKDENILLKH